MFPFQIYKTGPYLSLSFLPLIWRCPCSSQPSSFFSHCSHLFRDIPPSASHHLSPSIMLLSNKPSLPFLPFGWSSVFFSPLQENFHSCYFIFYLISHFHLFSAASIPATPLKLLVKVCSKLPVVKANGHVSVLILLGLWQHSFHLKHSPFSTSVDP